MRSRLVDISHFSFHRLVLLVLFVLSNTSVLPLTLLLCAKLDGGHSVELSYSRQSVGIRLTHTRTSADHHHSGWLTWFAANTKSSHHGDHELMIASGGGWPNASHNKSLNAVQAHLETTEILPKAGHFIAPRPLQPLRSPAFSAKLRPRGIRMQV